MGGTDSSSGSLLGKLIFNALSLHCLVCADYLSYIDCSFDGQSTWINCNCCRTVCNTLNSIAFGGAFGICRQHLKHAIKHARIYFEFAAPQHSSFSCSSEREYNFSAARIHAFKGLDLISSSISTMIFLFYLPLCVALEKKSSFTHSYCLWFSNTSIIVSITVVIYNRRFLFLFLGVTPLLWE